MYFLVIQGINTEFIFFELLLITNLHAIVIIF